MYFFFFLGKDNELCAWLLCNFLLTLKLLQIAEYNVHGNVHSMDPLKLDKQHLLSILQGKTYTSLNSLHVKDFVFFGVLVLVLCLRQ